MSITALASIVFSSADARAEGVAPVQPLVVEDGPGYNSWPMIQAVGRTLVCVYSRGTKHSIFECNRGIHARASQDSGKSWTDSVAVANNPDTGDVTIGKGLDMEGAALFWVRCAGKSWHHDLYRTTDGASFTRIASLKLNPMPMQITDILHVPTVGLMALWFAGTYGNTEKNCSWGTLTSADNGRTWCQNVVESGLSKGDWPTEPSAIYLGGGRLFAIARTENVPGREASENAQFQLQSEDFGKTWRRMRTNIRDICESTPCLLYDAQSGTVCNYYYQRGAGALKLRVVLARDIWDHPQEWSEPQVVATGSRDGCHAGNVNGTQLDGVHFMSFYSGDAATTSVVVAPVCAPKQKRTQGE